MKRAYWFLLVFGVWCAGCAYWYMFTMKGIRNDPRFFDPHVSTLAIAEILIMLLIACLAGLAIGWVMRDESMEILRETTEQLEEDNEVLEAARRKAKEELASTQQQLALANQSSAIKINKAKHEIDLLANEISGLKQELASVKESAGQKVEPGEAENEIGGLRYRLKQLEFLNRELEENNNRLKDELQNYSRKSISEPVHPFVRPVEMNERDDLTLIKGIGPFIEKRLNMVGIYTFRQISEFTPEMIEHVTKAIEFFPNRIVRDNWVYQASNLL